MAKNKRKRKPPRKRRRKREENLSIGFGPDEHVNPESRARMLWHRLFGPKGLKDDVAAIDPISESPVDVDKKTDAASRFRTLQRRLFRPKAEEDAVAAMNRMIEETCERAQKTLRHALREIRKEESARPRLSRKPPALARLDAVIAKMDREIRELRASARKRTGGAATTLATWQPDAARVRLEQLEKNLKRLAETRDSERDHANEWERRAMIAVKAENDELALEALSRKREHQQAHRLLAREHDHGVRVVALLRELLDAAEAGAAGSGA